MSDEENQENDEKNIEDEEEEELEEPTIDDVELEDILEFSEPIDIEGMIDGPTTLFVGGFSANCNTINRSLDYVSTKKDRIVVLPIIDEKIVYDPKTNSKKTPYVLHYQGDVTINTEKFSGIEIVGCTVHNTLEFKTPRVPTNDEDEDQEEEQEVEEQEEEDLDEISPEEIKRRRKALMAMKHNTTVDNIHINGKLILVSGSFEGQLATGLPEEGEEEEKDPSGEGAAEGDDEEGEQEKEEKDEANDEQPKKKIEERPEGLLINGFNFMLGAQCGDKSRAYIEDSSFGTPLFQQVCDIMVKVQALSSVEFKSCRFYGSNKCSIYCFPYSSPRFIDCDILSAESISSEEKNRRIDEANMIGGKLPRGYVRPVEQAACVPLTSNCSSGVCSDDSGAFFSNCDIKGFQIGLHCFNRNKLFKFEDSRVQEIVTVGIFLDKACEATIRSCTVCLCGRETLLICHESHPIIRDCVFIGDVRLHSDVVSTGITDNKIVVSNATNLSRESFAVEKKLRDKINAKKPPKGPEPTPVFIQDLHKDKGNEQFLLYPGKKHLIKGFEFTLKDPNEALLKNITVQ